MVTAAPTAADTRGETGNGTPAPQNPNHTPRSVSLRESDLVRPARRAFSGVFMAFWPAPVARARVRSFKPRRGRAYRCVRNTQQL
jgi:hypothetical protein